ncbi:uncharacterized protein [Misgurnus anguillicaudatus]|uniref:uncharacterized protein n=1 Tax=Misgurnus anguillicaudatus TaxID=75329 RepID=UPI003CCF6B5C
MTEAKHRNSQGFPKTLNQARYRSGMTDFGKKRKARIVKKIWVENQKVDLNLSVYLGVLPILKEYVMVFQGSKTLVHKLHDKQLEVFIDFLACFIKPEHLKMSANKLLELDLANNKLHSQIYVGKVAEDLIAAHPKHPVIIDFIEKVTKAYTTCGKYMQSKLPLKSKTLQALSSIDPVVRGHSQAVTQLKELARIMKHLVAEESDITQEIIRYNVDSNLAKYEDGDDIVKWWAHVMSLGKYPALSQVITGIDMFKPEDIKMGPVDTTLCQNIRAAGRRDKTDREKRMKAKQKRQAEYGCSAMCESAEKAKTAALAKEKQTRLKHVHQKMNAARRKALDTLQEVARKKRKNY